MSKWIKGKNYRKKILFEEDDLQSEGTRIQIVEIPGNQKVNPHHHKVQTEVYNVQKGTAILGIGDNEYEAGKGDTLICKPEQTHYVINESSETFRLLVFKTNYEENDTYWEES